MRKENTPGMIVVCCERTGNPWGTDTLKVGSYCGCKICEAVRFGEKMTTRQKEEEK